MDEQKDMNQLKKSIENRKGVRYTFTALALLFFTMMVFSCCSESSTASTSGEDMDAKMPLIFMVIGFVSIFGGKTAKSAQRRAENDLHLLWKASIDHTPGTETAQCSACFGPVFADASRCRHCGASFVDEGSTIIPFIGIGF